MEHKYPLEEGMMVYVDPDLAEDNSIIVNGEAMPTGWVKVDTVYDDGTFHITDKTAWMWYEAEWIDWFKTLGLTDGKPQRETVINHDDQINLKIAMETSKSLEEFLLLV